jgi:hypothetical protein
LLQDIYLRSFQIREDSGLFYGAQYVAYGEFLDDSPWGLERSDPEYNYQLKKALGESAALILNRPFDIDRDCKESSCEGSSIQFPYLDFKDVLLYLEGKPIGA